MTKDVLKQLPKVVSSFLARLIKEGEIKPRSMTGWVALESPEIREFISQALQKQEEEAEQRGYERAKREMSIKYGGQG